MPGLLVELPYNGRTVPALVQNLNTGLIFVFNRKTGKPLLSAFGAPCMAPPWATKLRAFDLNTVKRFGKPP
jgi:glucose dehydrogenase